VEELGDFGFEFFLRVGDAEVVDGGFCGCVHVESEPRRNMRCVWTPFRPRRGSWGSGRNSEWDLRAGDFMLSHGWSLVLCWEPVKGRFWSGLSCLPGRR
jgi:hypothetical protein